MIVDEDIFVEHYGVKGMKWGVRRGADGARPIAKTLNKSKFGKKQEQRVKARVNKKAARNTAKVAGVALAGLAVTTAASVGTAYVANRMTTPQYAKQPLKFSAKKPSDYLKALSTGKDFLDTTSGLMPYISKLEKGR